MGTSAAEQLRRQHNLSIVLLLGAFMVWGLGLFLGVELSGTWKASGILVLLGYAFAVALLVWGMTLSVKAKGHSTGWVVFGVLVSVCSPLFGLLVVAALPDRNKELRESAISVPVFYRPALYSVIVGIPMPYVDLPMAIHSFLKVRNSNGRLKGKLFAMIGFVVSLFMLCVFAWLIITEGLPK